MAGESSSSAPETTASEKPVIVRVKRKADQSPLDAFWLEISERPLKRPLLDFQKLSISDSAQKAEELKTKKVLVRHVETVTSSEATVDIVQSFFEPTYIGPRESKTKGEERKYAFKKDNRKDQLLSKAMQQQQVAAKNARFEQIWKSRKGNKDGIHDRALHEMCHFYDIVRVDTEERSKDELPKEATSLEDQRLLASYLPLLRKFIPSAAEELESDIHSYMSQQKEEYVYDYYTVNDEMKVDEEDIKHPFPLVQVEDEEFYDGPDDSEYDTEDSNAEDNPRNDYPDEIFDEEEEEEEEEDDDDEDEGDEDEEDESEASVESEDKTSWNRFKGSLCKDDAYDDYADDGYEFGYSDGEKEGDSEDFRWSYR